MGHIYLPVFTWKCSKLLSPPPPQLWRASYTPNDCQGCYTIGLPGEDGLGPTGNILHV